MAEKEAVIANLNSVPLLNLIRQQEEVGEEKKERRGFADLRNEGKCQREEKEKSFFSPSEVCKGKWHRASR